MLCGMLCQMSIVTLLELSDSLSLLACARLCPALSSYHLGNRESAVLTPKRQQKACVSVPGLRCTNKLFCLQQKFRRVRKMSDDEDDEEEDYGKEEHEKEAIAEEIFQDGEGEEGGEAVEAPVAPPEEEEEEEEDESGEYGWSKACHRIKALEPSKAFPEL